MSQSRTYTKSEAVKKTPNYWDIIALCMIFGILFLIAWGAKQMIVPYNIGQPTQISLNPMHLPYYALRTVLRMFIALFISLIFTFVIGTWAAKSKKAERFIIPLIDVMQSVPILSFLSLTVGGFILLFQGNMLGPELAAIFVIFTSQVWNMTLSFYQSVKTVPKDLNEVASVFQLSPWQKFWRIEAPFAMPGLLWNMMMSMSGSWFFVTAAEAISVSNQHIRLPGVGSYIALAISHADVHAIVYSIITMLVVILLYDQLLFRPLLQWSEKFKFEQVLDSKNYSSWFITLFQRTRFLKEFGPVIISIFDFFVNLSIFNKKNSYKTINSNKKFKNTIRLFVKYVMLSAVILTVVLIVRFLNQSITLQDLEETFKLGLFTAVRVIILIVICSFVWVPLGVWIGFRPRITKVVQPIIQFLAAFPANLMFPVAAILIIRYHLNINIWCAPLMVLGTQWYILFNVISGASNMPEELRLACKSFGIKGWLKLNYWLNYFRNSRSKSYPHSKWNPYKRTNYD